MQSPTHTECSSGFFPPRNRNRYIFFESCEVLAVFPFINMSCEDRFSFGQSSKLLSADRLRCDTDVRFYGATSVGFVSYILADLGLREELMRLCAAYENSHKANEFSHAAMRGFRESLHKTLQAYFHLPQSRLQASTKRTQARDARPFSNGTPSSQLKTNRIGIKWRA